MEPVPEVVRLPAGARSSTSRQVGALNLPRRLLVYATPVAAWLAFAGWLCHDFLRKAEAERAALRDRGETILVALQSGIRAITRSRSKRYSFFRQSRDALLKRLIDERASLLAEGELVPDELESRIETLSALRIGGTERLQASLDELAKSPSVFAIGILPAAGEAIMSVGELTRWAVGEPEDGHEAWMDGALILTRKMTEPPSEWIRRELGEEIKKRYLAARNRGRSDGKGPAPAPPREAKAPDQPRPPPPPPAHSKDAVLPAPSDGQKPESSPKQQDPTRGPIYARLALSRGELATAITQHLRMACTAGLFGLVAAALLAIVWDVSIRNREQAAELAVAGARNEHLREMQLAGAGLAHELRNPLNVLRGTAQAMLGAGDMENDVRGGLKCMVAEIDRVVSRLNGFVSFSRVPSPERSSVNAKQVAEQVVGLLQHASDANNTEVEFSDLPVIQADPGLFRQVIFNLLHNALRATEASGAVQVRAIRKEKSKATIEVSDTGIGVPEDIQGELFRPYCTGWDEGTGLGLSIVRQIALAHGWEVGYRPNEGGGSTFWIAGIEVVRSDGQPGPETSA